MPEYAVRLRPATGADAAALAQFAEQSFRETFGQANTASDVDHHCATSFGLGRQLAEIRDPLMSTLVAEAGPRLVGFGQLRNGAAPHCVRGQHPREIFRLYVQRAWQGHGIAQRLMAELLRRAFAAGSDSVWLGVWEHNPRAIAFYVA